MMRRDQQTGDPADGQVSLVINHADKCGFDSLSLVRRPPLGRTVSYWLQPSSGGSRIGFVRRYRAMGRGIGSPAGKLAQSGTNHLDRPPGAAESDAS